MVDSRNDIKSFQTDRFISGIEVRERSMPFTKVRSIMKEKKIGNKALAERTGIPLSTINNIVYGYITNPSLESMRAISIALDCTLDDLAENVEAASSDLDLAIEMLKRRPELVELVKAATAIDTDAVVSLITVIGFYKK